MMKKTGMWIALLLLTALCLAVPAAACERGDCVLKRAEPIPLEFVEAGPEVQVSLLAEPDYEGAVEALREAIWERRKSVDLSDYGIPASEKNQRWFGEVLSFMPEAFALSIGESPLVLSGGIYESMRFVYTMEEEDYEDAKALYTGAVDAITEQVDPDWSTVETLLFVHDWLAAHYEYDTDYEIYDAYGFFVEGKGVCQAYTMAVLAVLRELEIPVTYVESDELCHIWNLVQVGDAWYHIDVTHDDPLEDRLGCARHMYFLQSDGASFAAHTAKYGDTPPENDWVYGKNIPEAKRDDTRYDDWFWREALSPFVNADGVWYVVTGSGLSTWDGRSNGFGTLLEQDAYFSTDTSGLTLDRGTLYYNSYRDVRSCELFTGRQEIVLERTDAYFIGVFAEDGILQYEYVTMTGDTGEIAVELGSPYIAVEDGGYGCYVSNGTVFVQQEAQQAVVVACFDEDGRMLDAGLLTGTGSYRLKAAGSVKMFAADCSGWRPLCTVPFEGRVNRI